MKLTLMTLIALVFSFNILAKIAQQEKIELAKNFNEIKFLTISNSNEVKVIGALHKNELYSQKIILEVVIADLAYDKEIYIVNEANSDHLANRNTKANFKETKNWLEYDYKNAPQVLYIGRDQDYSSKFLILSSGTSANTFINLYVKMNGKQYSTKIKTY